MSKTDFNTGLLQFLQQSPTPFHAVKNMAAALQLAGFIELDERDAWKLEKNASYYVTRNDSSLIAFKTGTQDVVDTGIRLAAAHTDSPCLKIKPTPEIRQRGYLQLGVEVYGGALLHPWFDRDLSIAGRVDFQTREAALDSVLIDIKDPVAFIPSLAIHLDRTANEGRKINQQKELPAILLQLDSGEGFDLDEFLLAHLQQELGLDVADKVLSHELLLYDTQAPAMVGLKQQFIASARLDNLLSCHLICQALIESSDEYANLMVCNDHEEVGSVSASGAQGPFLKAVLGRIVNSQRTDADAYERTLRQSMLLSIDNAHGIHPNFPGKHDDKHSPLLNGGPVIKINANQRYASNSKSVALFKSLCEKLDVPYQSFVTRSDMACGSTIGPITAAGIGVTTVDVGLASFGMHSIRELVGAEDAEVLAEVVVAFYNRG